MPEGAGEIGTAGFPVQNAPEQGIDCDGGISSWRGSTDPLRINGSRTNASTVGCVRDLR